MQPSQGSARTPWHATRCLAFCRLTNPLTWPEHVLLTLRQPNLTNSAVQGPSQRLEQTRLQKALPGAWGLCADPSCRAGHTKRLTNSATCCWGMGGTVCQSPVLSELLSSTVEWNPSPPLNACNKGVAAQQGFQNRKRQGEGRLQGTR